MASIQDKIRDPKVFLEALKGKKYGYTYDEFIAKMLEERKDGKTGQNNREDNKRA